MERMVGLRHLRWWLLRRKMERFLVGHADVDRQRLEALFGKTLDEIWRGER